MSHKRIDKCLVGFGVQALTRYKPAQKMRPRRKGQNSYNNCLQCSKASCDPSFFSLRRKRLGCACHDPRGDVCARVADSRRGDRRRLAQTIRITNDEGDAILRAQWGAMAIRCKLACANHRTGERSLTLDIRQEASTRYRAFRRSEMTRRKQADPAARPYRFRPFAGCQSPFRHRPTSRRRDRQRTACQGQRPRPRGG